MIKDDTVEFTCGCRPVDMSIMRNEQLAGLVRQIQSMEVDRDIWKNEALQLRGCVVDYRKQIYALKDENKSLHRMIFESKPRRGFWRVLLGV